MNLTAKVRYQLHSTSGFCFSFLFVFPLLGLELVGMEMETFLCSHYVCINAQEGLEALVEEQPTKPNPRSSSKRSRAAEVHNLSEKVTLFPFILISKRYYHRFFFFFFDRSPEQRRRSRINEKMKALQNLIPNSNKVTQLDSKFGCYLVLMSSPFLSFCSSVSCKCNRLTRPRCWTKQLNI